MLRQQVGFAAGLSRPSGTSVERAVYRPNAERHAVTASEDEVVEQMQLAEEELARGEPQVAEAQLRLVHDAALKCSPLVSARLLFLLGHCCTSRSQLALADNFYKRCATVLERAVGSADPSLVPALLNRGCILVRRRRFFSAIETLRRARSVCDGLLGSAPRLGLLRSRVLHALGTALEGNGEIHEAEAMYRDALAAAEDDERLVSIAGDSGLDTGGSSETVTPSVRPSMSRPQPSRASLASLLQLRHDHEGALRLLDVQRAALRADQASHVSTDELAHASGRAAISAFALGRHAAAVAALREAVGARQRLQGGARMRQESKSCSRGSSPAATREGPTSGMQTDLSEPLQLARLALHLSSRTGDHE